MAVFFSLVNTIFTRYIVHRAGENGNLEATPQRKNVLMLQMIPVVFNNFKKMYITFVL